ncbi:cupin domain-containing protein [Thermoleptolyngbya sp. C42_A2020_037]|uniref:cupin domain-containing protein n=1 Tax=Thermoleptolyngbya sp. C42_A2020_037 TaxID=2747799 RepID=UPI0019D8E9F3|nr:cupin domain-containing protein [Thermoleptolyngbya sp. C42_A2020_037]MBF2087163.1 cupin domain-containing protein [Thermoleptolyngbya sp. C42_A2020_037]
MDHDPCLCDLTVLYALGLLDEDGLQQIHDSIKECPELATEMVELEETVATLPYSLDLMSPAADLKDRLFQRIHQDSVRPASSGISSEVVSPPPAKPAASFSFRQMREAVAAARVLMRQFSSGNRLTVRGRNLDWQPYRVPGVSVAPLYVDLAKREVTALLKAEPGAVYPIHRHATAEEIYMLDGDLRIDGEVYGAGDYIRSRQGTVHEPSETVGGCMFLVRTSLDDEYFELQTR